MRSWRLTLILCLITCFFDSCESDEFQKGDRIVIQNKFGQFLSADRNSHPFLKADTNIISQSAVFKIKSFIKGNLVISDFENNPVFIENDTLRWDTLEVNQRFHVDLINDRYYLKTEEDLFINSQHSFQTTSSQKGVIIHRLPRTNIFGGYMKNSSIVLISIAFLLFVYLLIRTFSRDKRFTSKLLYLGLFTAHFLVGYFAITQFDFFAPWDEQFHALVGRNLSENPWVPKLYLNNPVFPSNSWTHSEVWLHKPPLFLYQIALSIKLFGASVFSVRLPSLILMSLLGIIIYRLGILFFNFRVGIISSMLFCFSSYKIQLLFGMLATDHNDLSFLFYVTASIWALFEYQYKKSKKFYYAIFILAACAVLTKWLVGFMVYGTWLLLVLFQEDSIKEKKNKALSILKNFLLSLVLILPWHIYTFIRFPQQATLEMQLNGQHFWHAVEGHSGYWNYYIDMLKHHYGIGAFILLLLFAFSYFSSRNRAGFKALLTTVILVFLFFSLAATKMMSFTFVLAAIVFVLIAGGLDNLYLSFLHFHPNKSRLINSITVVSVCLFSLYLFKIEVLEKRYLNPQTGRNFFQESNDYLLFRNELKNQAYKKLGNTIKGPAILFNCDYVSAISVMFYNPKITAYNEIPDYGSFEKALKSGKKLVIFDNGKLPWYVLDHSDCLKIPNY